MNNFKRDQRKIDLENIEETDFDERYQKLDQVIRFDNENKPEIETVYLILAKPTTTPTENEDEEEGDSTTRILQEEEVLPKIYISAVRMNSEFGKESEVVWWIYLVLALIALVMLFVLGLFIVKILSNKTEDPEDLMDQEQDPNLGAKIESSTLSNSMQNFETQQGNMVPSELNNNYITPQKSKID